MERIMQQLKKLYEQKKLIPFVGAGLSYPFNIPTWEKLIKELATNVPERYQSAIEFDLNTKDYWSAISNIKKFGNFDELEIQEYVQKYILENQNTNIGVEDHNYNDLGSLDFRTYITTNYDSLLYENISTNKHMPLNLHDWNGSSIDLMGNESFARIWHLHGNLSNVGSIILSKNKYEELYSNQKFNSFFSSIEGNNSFLFLGFSFNDFYFSNLLKKYNDIFKVSHYILLDRPTSEQVSMLKEHYRLNVISYDSTEVGHVTKIREFLNDFKKKDKNIEKNSPYKTFWNVPFKRNPFFLGRENELKLIEDSLSSPNSIFLIKAVSGLGGVGKTQIAVEYCYRNKNKYSSIWWVNAENKATIVASYQELAKMLGLPINDDADNYIVIEVVKKWMQENSNWLLVFDNLLDENMLETLLPTYYSGKIIITTRNSNLSFIKNPLSIDKFIREDSIQFLFNRIKSEKENKEKCNELAHLLGDLPLALEQASAYIIQTGISIKGYIERFNKYRVNLINKGIPINYGYNLATTWEISFEEIANKNTLALEFIYLCSFFSSDVISLNIFDVSSESPGFLKENFPTELEIDEVLSILRSFSLIKSSEEGFSIHQLVQAVIRDKLSQVDVASFICLAMDIIENSWASNKINKIFLISHCITVIEHAVNHNCGLEKVSKLLSYLGMYHTQIGDYKKSLESFKKVLTIHKGLGSDNKILSGVYNHLSICYINLSEFSQAEKNIVKCLKLITNRDKEKLNYLNTLATLEKNRGNFSKAIDIYFWILKHIDDEVEEHHINRLVLYNNLATALDLAGEEKRAEEYYKVTIESLKDTDGTDIQSSLILTYNNLALLLEKVGRCNEAIDYLQKALKLTKENLKDNNILLLRCYGNLGFVYLRTYQNNEMLGNEINNELLLAKKYLNRASRLFSELLGREHLDYCMILNNIGMLYEKEKDFNKAKEKYHEGIKIIKDVLGEPNHYLLSQLESNLGSLSWMLGEFEKGEELLLSTLKRDITIFGNENVEVAIDLDKIGLMYFNAERYDESIEYYKKAYSTFVKTIGKHHEKTVVCLENLFFAYTHQGNTFDSKKVLSTLLLDSKKVFGKNHPRVLLLKKYL